MNKKSLLIELDKLNKEDLIEIIEDLAKLNATNYHFLVYNLSEPLEETLFKKIFDNFQQKLKEMISFGRSLDDYSFLIKDIRIYLRENMKIFKGDKKLIQEILFETQSQLLSQISLKKKVHIKNQRWIILMFDEIYSCLNTIGKISESEINRFENQLNILKSVNLVLYEVLHYLFVNKIKGA